jgi:hypothetical protein
MKVILPFVLIVPQRSIGTRGVNTLFMLQLRRAQSAAPHFFMPCTPRVQPDSITINAPAYSGVQPLIQGEHP